MAGTGKSTIARTIALEYETQSRLGASFIFSRGDGDLSKASKFFTSIAIQLAQKSPALRCEIFKAVAEHKDIAKRALAEQWEQLVFRPLNTTKLDLLQRPLLLVIDALDECEDIEDVQAILRLFGAPNKLAAVQLRVLITSRPDTPIRLSFHDISGVIRRDLILHRVARDIVDHDIDIYIRHEMKHVKLNEQDVKKLVEKASGLFIWAATACRYIKKGKRVMSTRISLILEGGKSTGNPEKDLDQIYTKILSDSISGEYEPEEYKVLFELFRKIVGTIVLIHSSLTIDALSKLLGEYVQHVEETLSDLHSVLDISGNSTDPIRILHPSFRDFLISKGRCQDARLQVDEKQTHLNLTKSCLQLLSTVLKQDICCLDTPGVLVTDVEKSQVDQYLPLEIQYACLYWVKHIQKSEIQLQDDGPVHKFVQKHLLHWLEALSWIGKTSEGILAIFSLEAQILVSLLQIITREFN